MNLDGNTFFFYNKIYPHARIVQWNTHNGTGDVGTYEELFSSDQLWIVERSQADSGYYYINNARHEGFRLAKWGKANNQVFAYDRQYAEDQLWRFQQEGDFYRIYNKAYPLSKITKWGKGNNDWGTYDGDNSDDQLWKLVPRFSAKAREHEIWSIDNRQGSEHVTKEFKTTIGVKLTESNTLSVKVGFEQSLKFSLSVGVEGISAGMESTSTFSKQIESSVSGSEERSWSQVTTTTYTAPAGKKYRVLQTLVDFSSPLQVDNCCLYCNERIEESS